MDFNKKELINELNKGKELANQLKNHPSCSSSSSSSTSSFFFEKPDDLVQKILHSYEKAISMMNSGSDVVEEGFHPIITSTSLNSQIYDLVHPQKHIFKKRKTMNKDKVSSRTRGEAGSIHDGYSWRKYGQKNIIRSKFPREYYRCTHRFTRSCLATKQVQKSDDDPKIFDVVYHGIHLCHQSSDFLHTDENKKDHLRNQEVIPRMSHETFLDFDLEKFKVIRADEPDHRDGHIYKQGFESQYNAKINDVLMENISRESKFATGNRCDMNINFGQDQDRQTMECDLSNEMISGLTSSNNDFSNEIEMANSPVGDIDFSSLNKVELDLDMRFLFDGRF